VDLYPADAFIIMDNGLIETGKPAAKQTLIDACDLVHADCLVLPDALGDYKETLKLSSEALPELRSSDIPLMGVVQGSTVEEVTAIIDFYAAQPQVKYLSIPRVMVEIFGTRRWIVEKARWKKLPIHLLGFSDNLEDDFLCAAMSGVMGIDSAVPIWRGLMPIAEYMPARPPRHWDVGKRPADYWDKVPDDHRVDMDIVVANIRWTRSWISRFVPPNVAQTAP
jgi:hypothetical protein